MTLFNWLSEITENKSDWGKFTEEDYKQFNVYMITKYLSMSQNYIELTNYVQKYNQLLSPKQIYDLYKNLIPVKKVWLKYIKSTTKEKQNNDLIKLLADYFECSQTEAFINSRILTKEQLTEILIEHGKDSKEIKQLLK